MQGGTWGPLENGFPCETVENLAARIGSGSIRQGAPLDATRWPPHAGTDKPPFGHKSTFEITAAPIRNRGKELEKTGRWLMVRSAHSEDPFAGVNVTRPPISLRDAFCLPGGPMKGRGGQRRRLIDGAVRRGLARPWTESSGQSVLRWAMYANIYARGLQPPTPPSRTVQTWTVDVIGQKPTPCAPSAAECWDNPAISHAGRRTGWLLDIRAPI